MKAFIQMCLMIIWCHWSYHHIPPPGRGGQIKGGGGGGSVGSRNVRNCLCVSCCLRSGEPVKQCPLLPTANMPCLVHEATALLQGGRPTAREKR